MPPIWHILAKKFARPAVAVLGILAILVSCLQLTCSLPHVDQDAVAAVQTGGAISNCSAGDCLDPDDCGHCHCCTAPCATINEDHLMFPAPSLGRNLQALPRDEALAGVSVAPDPAPDRG